MKKVVYIASAIILLALVHLSVQYVMFSSQEASAIGIIGGADGPTAVFLASKVNPSVSIFLVVGVLLLIGVVFLKKR